MHWDALTLDFKQYRVVAGAGVVGVVCIISGRQASVIKEDSLADVVIGLPLVRTQRRKKQDNQQNLPLSTSKELTFGSNAQQRVWLSFNKFLLEMIECRPLSGERQQFRSLPKR